MSETGSQPIQVPELDPDYRIVLSPVEIFQQKRKESERSAAELLTEFREGQHPEFPRREARSSNMIAGIRALNPFWRSELLFLLTVVEGCALRHLCALVQITTTQLFQWRKVDPDLDDAVKAFQAASFEHMAETPGSGIPPAVISFGLEARALWRRRMELTVDAEQVVKILEEVIEVVSRVVQDPEKMRLIIQELERRELNLPALMSGAPVTVQAPPQEIKDPGMQMQCKAIGVLHEALGDADKIREEARKGLPRGDQGEAC